jgi:hypothetical protein
LCGVVNQTYAQSRSGGAPLFCCQLNVTDSASYPYLDCGLDTVLGDSNNSGLFIEPKISVRFSPQLVIGRKTRRHLSKMVSNIIFPYTPASTKGRFPPKFLRPTHLLRQTNSAAGWIVSPSSGLCLVNYKEVCYVRLTAGCIADMLTP